MNYSTIYVCKLDGTHLQTNRFNTPVENHVRVCKTKSTYLQNLIMKNSITFYYTRLQICSDICANRHHDVRDTICRATLLHVCKYDNIKYYNPANSSSHLGNDSLTIHHHFFANKKKPENHSYLQTSTENLFANTRMFADSWYAFANNFISQMRSNIYK